MVALQWSLCGSLEGGWCLHQQCSHYDYTMPLHWRSCLVQDLFCCIFTGKDYIGKNTKGGTFVINSLKILWKPAMALITKTLQDATSCKVFYLINLQHHAKVENCQQILSNTKLIAQWSKHLLESQGTFWVFTKQTRGLGLCSQENLQGCKWLRKGNNFWDKRTWKSWIFKKK